MVIMQLKITFIMSRETSAHSKFGLTFVVSFFDWSIFGKYGSRLVHWKCRVIFKVGKNKSGMPHDFCVVDDWLGKNEALCQWSPQRVDNS